ncbi:MAG: ECF transporter S component [Dysosmobacter welbionis]
MKHSNFKTNVHNLVLAAMFLALALVLPFLTGQIPQIGGMLLPCTCRVPLQPDLRLAVWRGGGFVAPLMRMALFGMPPLVAAVAMAFELAAYGGIAGFLYNRSRWQCVVALYRALLAAMVGGRIVWAAVRVVMTGVASVPFTWQIFLTEALVNAIPGIILQLVFIPVLMVALDRTGMVRFRREQAGTQAAGN